MTIPDDVMIAACESTDEIYKPEANNWYTKRDIIARAIMAERERCARVAEAHKLLEHPRLSPGSEINAWWSGQERASIAIAAAIRRGDA